MRAMWPIARRVVPPSLRTRSAFGNRRSAFADRRSAFGDRGSHFAELVGLLVEQDVVVATVRPVQVPVKNLRLQMEREYISQHAVHCRSDVPRAAGLRSAGVSNGAL